MLKQLLTVLCLFLAAPAVAQPNIVLILVDDFSMNLMPAATGPTHMPNLRQMQREGMTFSRYFVSNPLCCPSRATILTGMLPHNTGVVSNGPPNGGLSAFTANGLEAETFALPLQAAGYMTAYFGKYLNGYDQEASPIPPGWNEWASTDHKGYAAFGYTLNINGALSQPPDHMTDQISALGRQFLNRQDGPFFLALAPFSVHGPFTPPTRHTTSFLDVPLPQTPAYGAIADADAPQWLRALAPLTATDHARFQRNYVERLQSAKAVDEMIGRIRNRLALNGLADNTYIIFTSDNGLHMGEMSMRNGKLTPFDFDINVPLVMVGPGIAPGSTSGAIATNADLHPTFLELAGAPADEAADGRSLVPVLAGGASTRTMAVVERTFRTFDPTDPDWEPPAGQPPVYNALRGADWLYVEYLTGEVSYYDMASDPHQLRNIAASLSDERRAELHAALIANTTCVGEACAAAQDILLTAP